MHATAEGIQTLNSLLRGEIAATETYNQAMEKMKGYTGSSEIRRIRDDHREAANMLRQHVRDQGGKPDQDSGAWGTWAKLVEGTAKLFGTQSALKALKEGEEQGVSSYEEVLQDEDLPIECKEAIRSTLLQTREHIATVDRLMAAES